MRAIHQGTRCIPLLVPVTIDTATDWQSLCNILDGLLLTGSRTNVHPSHYTGPSSEPGTLHDLERDTTVFGLVDIALQHKMPVFGICRGFQELNVALGGTLHQKLEELKDKQHHAPHKSLPPAEQYQAAHPVTLTDGGYLQKLIGEQHIMVNSLHHQGVQQLADRLSADAIAADGVIEAFSLKNEDQFLVAVQWHPEWHISTDPVSKALFDAFDLAVYDYAKLKHSRKNEL
jgi:putative glutamine amidotransferase